MVKVFIVCKRINPRGLEIQEVFASEDEAWDWIETQNYNLSSENPFYIEEKEISNYHKDDYIKVRALCENLILYINELKTNYRDGSMHYGDVIKSFLLQVTNIWKD